MSKLLKVKGSVLPLTEEKVELVGHSETEDYMGEVAVSQNIKDIDYLTYDKPFEVSSEVLERIADADLIILSPGSLYTSIIPHLIAPAVRDALCKSKAPIMYTCNLVTQPGETDGYSVGDHIAVLNRYLGDRKVDVVIANDGPVEMKVTDVYKTENKTVVELDESIDKLGVETIVDDLVTVDEVGSIRHDELKTAYLIFSYLMR